MADDYRALVKQAALDEESFVQLTFRGALSAEVPWRQVVVRPVLIRNQRRWQMSHLDARQDITRNYAEAEAAAKLDELLAIPFSSIRLRTTAQDMTVQFTRKGKAIIHRAPVDQPRQPTLAHDAAKDLPIPVDRPDPFLQAVGIMTRDGRVKADMQDKFTQINEFLKLLNHTAALDSFGHTPLQILDCGCGSSLLSLAVHHYLNQVRGIPAAIVGVDVNPALIAKSMTLSADLGLSNACFFQSAIRDYRPEQAPDIVIALHACDTATDEALAQGIQHGARIILAAPCCHHDLHRQLETRPPFAPVMRHGILRQRLADILTDSFRALILRILGYKTDVVEFIASEHTDRNLMIRAVLRAAPGDAAFVAEYIALKAYWGVTPCLETLLGAAFTDLLGAAQQNEHLA